MERDKSLEFLEKCLEEIRNMSKEEYKKRKREKSLDFEKAYYDNSFIITKSKIYTAEFYDYILEVISEIKEDSVEGYWVKEVQICYYCGGLMNECGEIEHEKDCVIEKLNYIEKKIKE